MDRHLISRLAHTHHPIAAPLDDVAVAGVLEHAGGGRLLDLGCGGAEWLIRALERDLEATAVGVDVSQPALARARAEADRRGVGDRLTLHHQDAGAYADGQPFDVVFSVGAAHVFGGLKPTLAAADRHLAPKGRVVLGDGFWEAPPSAAAVEMLGETGRSGRHPGHGRGRGVDPGARPHQHPR